MELRNTELRYEAGHWFFDLDDFKLWVRAGKPATWNGHTSSSLGVAAWSGAISGRMSSLQDEIRNSLSKRLRENFPVAAKALTTGNFEPLASLVLEHLADRGIRDYIRELAYVEEGHRKKEHDETTA